MSIDHRVMNSTVRITTAGTFLGSGTIIGVRSESNSDRYWPYLVTAHHVVRAQTLIEVDVPDPTTLGHMFEAVSVEDVADGVSRYRPSTWQ